MGHKDYRHNSETISDGNGKMNGKKLLWEKSTIRE